MINKNIQGTVALAYKGSHPIWVWFTPKENMVKFKKTSGKFAEDQAQNLSG